MSATSGSAEFMDSPQLVAPRGHYCHVAVHAGVAYLSGQLPVTPDGTTLADRPFEEQARQVLANIEACLDTVGVGRDALLSVTVFVTDIERWAEFDALYAAWLGEHRPARIVATVAQLHYGAAIEISAVAAVS